MDFHVMTLFPDMITNAMSESITGRALKAGYLALEAVNIRDFAVSDRSTSQLLIRPAPGFLS